MSWPETPVLPHLRISWGGTLGDSNQDIWSNALNFRVSGGGNPDASELEEIAAAVAPFLKFFVTGLVFDVSPAVAMRWVKAVWVLGTGKQRDQNTAIFDLPSIGRGVGSAKIWEQTYALTLRTALKRGRGHAGRIYPPICGPQPSGQSPYAAVDFANDAAANYATGIKAVRDAINSTMNDALRTAFLTIVSRGTAANPTPLLTDVTTCVIDRVADIQHRRVNRVPRAEGTPASISL